MGRRSGECRGERAILASALAAAVLALGGGCGGDSGDAPSDAELQSVVDGITENVFIGEGFGPKQTFHVPGSALTVDEGEGEARSFASGVSDITDERPLGLDQVQPVGSATKTVTAVLAMRLVEDGRVGLDETIPEIAAANDGDGGELQALADEFPERLRDVTLRELLNHTSGLAEFLFGASRTFNEAWARDPLRQWTLARRARLGLEEPPLFRPGARGKWNYSNTEYILAGMVIEAVSGESVGEQMAALFEEVGMDSSRYAPTPAEVREPPLSETVIHGYLPPVPRGTTLPPVEELVVKGLEDAPWVVETVGAPPAVWAVSTNPKESGPTVGLTRARGAEAERAERQRRFRFQDMTNAYTIEVGGPAGAIVSNTEDLAAFWRALFDGDLVDPETLREMQRTVPVYEDDSKGVEARWGLGFGEQRIEPDVLFEGSPALTVWLHLGNIMGYSSASYYVEEEDLVVNNTVNIFPQPVGDLGLLRDVLRAYARASD